VSVLMTYQSRNSDLGNEIVLEILSHSCSRLIRRLQECDRITNTISTIGSTCNSSQYYLHFEVEQQRGPDGRPIRPKKADKTATATHKKRKPINPGELQPLGFVICTI
jgi:hypothetical protein